MNDHKLKLRVTELVALDREIADLTEKLKAGKAELIAEAASRADEAVATEGGGTSTIFEGADGCVARITVAGPTLKASLSGEGRDLAKVRELVDGPAFQRLFAPAVNYKPAENFRELALGMLGAREAKALLKVCTNAGKTSVAFETKEVAS